MIRKSLALGCAFTFALALPIAVEGIARASFGCEHESGLCLEPVKGGSWAPDKRSSDADRKKRSTASAGSLSVAIEGGRGSVFINGRYAGTAPLDGVQIPSGPNDLQVRDGAQVLATGVLTVPKSTGVSIVVRHD